jgi:histidinol phosphatase-like enzyme
MELPPSVCMVDIDGTLCEYDLDVIKGFKDMTLLPGTLEKLDEWNGKGYQIILTTGRLASRERTIEQLEKAGIVYDQLVTDIGGGKRIIINDIKPDGTLTAVAYNLLRNQGISSINE